MGEDANLSAKQWEIPEPSNHFLLPSFSISISHIMITSTLFIFTL